MAALETPVFSIHDFLRQESTKDLLRFSTAGSVDDGKSTLIGRLLYDTQSVYDDQVRSIEGKGTTAPGQLDFALLTDGLRAEREQGITIDVAYRYFSTAKRKFIIADTPGHEQYTRNMATGASTADAAVVLIDASKGVLVQSRRHAYIAALLRVRHVIVAVNKMDLIGYDEATFRAIEIDFRNVLGQIAADTGSSVEAAFVPVSALAGDNIVHRTDAMPWYTGPIAIATAGAVAALDRHAHRALPLARAARRCAPTTPSAASPAKSLPARCAPATPFVALPSGRAAKVERIVTWDGDLEEAVAPLSVTLVLDRELDISRGDLIASAGAQAIVANRVSAALVWMDHKPLERTRRYKLKHASHTVPAFVSSIEHRTRVETLAHEPAETLEMNSIGAVTLSLLRPIAFDRYADNRSTGNFILIDPATNATVAAGMITSAAEDDGAAQDPWGPVSVGEREARWGHRGGVLELTGPAALIDAVERSLFGMGAVTTRIDAASLAQPELLRLLIDAQTRSGLLTLVTHIDDDAPLKATAEGESVEIEPGDFMRAVAAVHQLLHRAGIFVAAEKANL